MTRSPTSRLAAFAFGIVLGSGSLFALSLPRGLAQAAPPVAPPTSSSPAEPAAAPRGAPTVPRTDSPSPTGPQFDSTLAEWDLGQAKSALFRASTAGERFAMEGLIAFHEARYVEASWALSRATAQGALPAGASLHDDAVRTLPLARAAEHLFAGKTVLRSPSGAFEAAFADPKDEILAPYLFEALEQAKVALTHDLGMVLPERVRFEILADPADLAKVTPLALKHVRTTGTVGITKYRRVMMLTPRVLLRGYGWLDTAVHEFVHYLVTLRTKNQAPVWLQEGLAKLLETRWRSPTPLPITAAAATLLRRAVAANDLVTLDEMYPSVAMLPSQERAALAYAEVHTMLELVARERGTGALHALLDAVAAGTRAEDAIALAFGTSFDQFFDAWKQSLRATKSQRSGPAFSKLEFIDPDAPATGTADREVYGDLFSHLGGGKARQHARLGVLLAIRGHQAAAVVEYERARSQSRAAHDDPALCRRLGEAYFDLGRLPEAEPLLRIAAQHDPENAALAALFGHAALAVGRTSDAREALAHAIRNNPFIPQVHCDLATLAPDAPSRAREATLCPHP